MKTLYNAIVWQADKTADKDVVFKKNDFVVADSKLYIGDGESDFDSLSPVADVALAVGDIPNLGANKITKLNGTHSFGVDDVEGIDVIKSGDSLNEALDKLQEQVIAVLEKIE